MSPGRLFSLKNRKILVVTHKGADVDALASAAIVRAALMEKNIVEIAIPEHINNAAKKLAEEMEIAYSMQPNFSEFDTLVIVDLNSYAMLGNFAEQVKIFSGEKFLFDHHSITKEALVDCKHSMIREDAASTTEVLWEFLIESAPEKIDKTVATLIACGIISDTDRFSFASRNTFRIMADVVPKTGKSFNELVDMLSVYRDISERIAMLKAMKKIRIIRVGKNIVAVSESGSFESQVAEALVVLGADASLVGAMSDGTARISGRASFAFASQYNIDLAKDVFQKLSLFFRGEGGGHATAAAFTGAMENVEDALEKCLELLVAKIREKEPEAIVKEYR